jgi:hypothetical protein
MRQGFDHYQGSGHCCCQPGGFQEGLFRRRFSTRKERITQLEEYLNELKEEAKAVEEHLARMKAGK